MTNEEMEKTLCEKYPKIFGGRLTWGIEHNSGWFPILDALCRCIQSHCDNEEFQVVAAQIKEKYGTLRFYIDGGDETIFAMINMAEAMSARMCEMCGATEDVTTEGESWTKTLCRECRGGTNG